MSSAGADSAPGTLEHPKATLEAAYELLRDGHADWMLLRRGDTWRVTQMFTWSKTGPARDGEGFMRLGAYGDESLPRPTIDSGSEGALVITPGWRSDRSIRHVAFTDLHLIAGQRLADPARATDNRNGVQLVAVEHKGSSLPFSHLLFENLKIHGYSYGLVAGTDVEHLSLRRNIFYRIFNPGGAGQHSSGVLLSPQGSGLLEENVFYLCQHPDMPAVDGFALFSNSAYVGSDAKNVVARGNLIIKSPDGMMQRPGGTYELNVSAHNAIAYHLGQANGVKPTETGVLAFVRNNLFLDDGTGPNLGNTRSGEVSDNLVVVDRDGGDKRPGVSLIGRNDQKNGGQLLGTNVGVHGVTFSRNHLAGDFTYTNPREDKRHYSGQTFVDNHVHVGPVATSVGDFLAKRGLKGRTIDDLGELLAARDRATFASTPDALAIINHYRQAMGLPAVAPRERAPANGAR